MSWAHRPLAQITRKWILLYVLGPIITHYTHPSVRGTEHLSSLVAPVVFAANHSSHMDTPLILRALPGRWRRRTAVVAAADYFFRNRLVAGLVSLAFGAVPIERKAGARDSARRLNNLVQASTNLLVYPEGTRSRNGEMGPLRSGAARLAIAHGIPIVPIRVSGSHDAMPPGQWWPRRFPVAVSFGPAIRPAPGEDHKGVTERVERALRSMRDDG
ncbi:MAG: lysophospholipid acyltransferase family protein [Actinomycetota bacterium]